jgi:hypothetical protein
LSDRSPELEAWIDEARHADCYDVLGRIRPDHRLKKTASEYVGPCPACGGRDRFAIHRRRNVWLCRMAGEGGDAIALVQYLNGANFYGAVELITGRAAPDGGRGQTHDPEFIARQKAEADARRIKAERELNDFRGREIRRAHDIWKAAGPIAGSIAEAYLRFRGVNPARGAKLRSLSKLPYWHQIDGQWKVIHEGPAMIAAIQDREHMFIGCHCTWIDAEFRSRSGKAEIVHPQTGELLDAKKVRGSQKGGHIHLAGDAQAWRLILGEGIETVYAVREALLADPAEAEIASLFWAAVNLGNIGGRATESVTHPTLTSTDKRGRVRRARVPGPDPDPGDIDCLRPPAHVRDITLLGDGDSDRFTTENVLKRFAARWHQPGRIIRAAWAEPGLDFNDMMKGAA